jgi:hypothetical protein
MATGFTAIDAILQSQNKKPDYQVSIISHSSPVLRFDLRQPDYPEGSGPVAFRPRLATGLALSSIFFKHCLCIVQILCQILSVLNKLIFEL